MDYCITIHSAHLVYVTCYHDGAFRYTRKISITAARRLHKKVGQSHIAWLPLNVVA